MSRILYEINEEALKYFHARLRSDLGAEGGYFLKRFGLTKETIDRFKLGYAGDGKRELVNYN